MSLKYWPIIFLLVRLISNFLQKLNLATKTLRHKGKMRSIFLLRAFAPSWQTFFRSEAEKKAFFLSFVKSLKNRYTPAKIPANCHPYI
jgi:hypothetical protein